MEHVRTTTQKLIKGWSSMGQRGDALKQGLKRLFTPQERRHIKRYALRGARLILNIDSSAWLYLLNFKKKQLLKNVNKILEPNQEITEIRLRLDRNETKD